MEQGDLKKLSEESTIAKVGKEKFSSLTGYFNESNKRIDIVLVFKDDGNDETKRMRLNFLMNAIQVGLEAEVESGKMADHRNLVFVKLHAPEEIIEQYGLYFNEKRYFKDSHLDFVNPIFNIFGTKNERELLKIVRYWGWCSTFFFVLQFQQQVSHWGKILERKSALKRNISYAKELLTNLNLKVIVFG
ncbi:anoctamin-4-like isoform X1 [Danaus plexippus]|uniref:anoctamin-4-like isoform X1 n=1 Tax=Danaus plexippus TaxID=13037 RepID=UPI002AAFF648|nr:anoctamin-4-like isoform X1 [Danaus plexippus]